MKILDFLFGKNKKSNQSYELVEHQIDDNTFRQGVRLLHSKYHNVVVTLDPVVKLDPTDTELKVSFGFTIESNPNHIEIDKEELRSIVGDVVIDLVKKDYS